MTYPYAVSAILPAAMRDDGDRMSWALGYQPDPATGVRTFVAPLSADGGEPATHYGFNSQASVQAFVDMLQAAKAGELAPVAWEDYGLTESRVRELMEAMDVEVSGRDTRPWDALLERLGLMTVRTEEA